MTFEQLAELVIQVAENRKTTREEKVEVIAAQLETTYNDGVKSQTRRRDDGR